MPKIYFLYSYSLTHLTKTNRVKVVYVLKGRHKEQGLIHALKGTFICNGCFIIPEKNNKEILDVLAQWNVKFTVRKIMLIN